MTFFILTFGCQMNFYDSLNLRGLLRASGYLEADSPEEADIVLVNTCTVREHADRKALERIRRYGKGGKIVGVLGCLAEIQHERVFEAGANLVMGPGSYRMLPRALEEVISGTGRQRIDRDDGFPDFRPAIPLLRGQFSAFVSIMKGCDNYCAYCIVPYARGREVSRDSSEILRELNELEDQGIIEVTLLGQNVNAYFDGRLTLVELLREIDRNTGFDRVRFTTSHPRDITGELLDVIQGSKRITDWFHLPLQSGSTEVLRRMRRGYTKEEYLDLCHEIRERFPEGTITTDLMVGFPGETRAEFEETLDVVRRVEFDGAYTFIYCDRPRTIASRCSDKVDEGTQGSRLRELIDAVNERVRHRRKRMIGKSYEILVEKPSRKDPSIMAGRNRGNVMCLVPGSFGTGTFVRGVVVEIRGHAPLIEVEGTGPPRS
jgi:tRNA-2-methylthio-N6-dimethylallyladenosine synthase